VRTFDFSSIPNHVAWDEREKLRREKEASDFTSPVILWTVTRKK